MSLVNEYIKAITEHISKMQRTDWPNLYIDEPAEDLNINIRDFYVMPTIHVMGSSSEDENNSNNFLMIRGDAGSGKSLFARRLMLGLLERDEEFSSELPDRLKQIYDENRLPIYFEFDAEKFRDCRDIECFITSIAACASEDLQPYFSDSEKIVEIRQMIIDRIHGGNVCIFADGLSDLMEENIRNDCFLKLLQLIKDHPDAIFVACIRDLGIFRHIPGFMEMRDSLKRTEIDLYYKDGQVEGLYDIYAELYRRLKGEAANTPEVDVKSFRKQLFQEEYKYSPVIIGYMLNLIWSRKAISSHTEQIECYVEALVYWNSNKKNSCLSKETALGMLAFIAFSSMKNNELFISWERIKEMVALYISDAGDLFSEGLCDISVDEIAREVANADIMAENDRAEFLFYDAFFHNDVFEYLIAYGIVHHIVDEDLRDYKAHRIVCDVFEYFENGSRWCCVSGEGIIRFIFNFQDKEVNHDIAIRMLNNRDDLNEYAKILLNCITDGACIDDKIRYEVYEILFTNDKISGWDISLLNIRCGSGLATMAKDASLLFMEENRYELGMFCAAMEVIQLSTSGESPFEAAEKMIMSGSLNEIKKGMLMMTVLRMSSGFDIGHYYKPQMLEKIRELLTKSQSKDFYETVHTAINKSGFAFDQLVSDEALQFLNEEYEHGNTDVECVLELEPEEEHVYEHEFDIMGTKYRVSFYKDLVKYGEMMDLVRKEGEGRLADRLAIMSRKNWIKSIYINNRLIENYRELLSEKVQKGDAISVINDALCMISYDGKDFLNVGVEYIKKYFSEGRMKNTDDAQFWWFEEEADVTEYVERLIIAYWLYKSGIMKNEDFEELEEADISFWYELYPGLFGEEVQKEMRDVLDENE